jgi:zinc D-Ala-D-Ala carboxypeptidase
MSIPTAFKCKCGCEQNNMDAGFAAKIVALCVAINKRLEDILTSGYRCEKHNAAVGGVHNSEHTQGLAADLACTDSVLRGHIVKQAIRLGLVSFGVSDTFVHVDGRPVTRLFLYPRK